MGITSTYQKRRERLIDQAEYDAFYDQKMPARDKVAEVMAKFAERIPYSAFLPVYEAVYLQNMSEELRTLFISRSAEIDYRGFATEPAARPRAGQLDVHATDEDVADLSASIKPIGPQMHDFTIIDSDRQPYRLTLPYDVVAVHEATKTAAFERASSLDRYFFGVPGKSFGTLRQAILAQAVATAAPGQIGATGALFDVDALRRVPGSIDFPIHEIHPLFGNPNSMIGEAALMPLLATELEMQTVDDLLSPSGIDFAGNADAVLSALVPHMSVVNSQITDAQIPAWPLAGPAVHSGELEALKQEALALREAGGDIEPVRQRYIAAVARQIAAMNGPEALYEDYLKLAALDRLLGVTRAYMGLRAGALTQLAYDSILDQDMPSREPLAVTMAEVAQQLPYADFLASYDALYRPRLLAPIQQAIAARSAEMDYRGFEPVPDASFPTDLRLSRRVTGEGADSPLSAFTGDATVVVNGAPAEAVGFAGMQLSTAQLASLARAPDGSSINVTMAGEGKNQIVTLEVINEALLSKPSQQRLQIGIDGRPVVINRMINLRSDANLPKGFGLVALTRQVEAARALGFRAIVSESFSDGTGEYVGPYVWGSYGFDGRIPEAARRELPEALQPYYRVSEFAQDRALMAEWKAFVASHSIEMLMSFDLSEDAPSQQVLDQALSRRGLPTLAERQAATETQTLPAEASEPALAGGFANFSPAEFVNALLPPEAKVVDPRLWAQMPGRAKTFESLGIRPVVPFRDEGGLLVGGVNSNETIRALTSINGYRVGDLEKAMYPSTDAPADSPHKSISGFLGEGESLIARLVADNTTVSSFGLTHQQVAATMSWFISMGDIYGGMRTRGTEGDVIAFNGRRFNVVRDNWGLQPSPFHDGTESRGDYEVINLETGDRIKVATLVRDMVERYGFYEGETRYRVDPADWIRFIGLNDGRQPDNDGPGGNGGPNGGGGKPTGRDHDGVARSEGSDSEQAGAPQLTTERLLSPSLGGYRGNQAVVRNTKTGQPAFVLNTQSGFAAVRLDSVNGAPAFDLANVSVSEGMNMLPAAFDDQIKAARKIRETVAGAALSEALAASHLSSLQAVKAVGAAMRGFNMLASVENEIGVTLLTLRDEEGERTVAVPELIIGNFTSTMMPMIDISAFPPESVIGVHRLHSHPAEGSILAWSQALLSDSDVGVARDMAQVDDANFPNLEYSALYSVDGLTGGITRFMTDMTDPEWPELLAMIGDNLPARTGLGRGFVVNTPALEEGTTMEPGSALDARNEIAVQHKAWKQSYEALTQELATIGEVTFLRNQTGPMARRSSRPSRSCRFKCRRAPTP